MGRLTIRLILLLFLLVGVAKTQANQRIDSLYKLSQKVPGTKKQVDLLNEICHISDSINEKNMRDTIKFFSLLAIQNARSIEYHDGLAKALYNLGGFYIKNYEVAEATPFFLESLELYKKLNKDTNVAKCYMQLGIVSYLLQYYEAAIKNFKLSLKISDNATCNYLMALSYTEIDSFSLAKKYFSTSIHQFEKHQETKRLNESYLWLGRLYLKTGEIDSAFNYIQKAIQGTETKNDPYALIRHYAFISEVYLKKNNPTKAIAFAEKSFELENNKKSEGKDNISLLQASKILSAAYAKKGNFKQAYHYLEQYNHINNHYTEGSIKQKVADMQSMFEFEQKMNLQKVRQQKDKEIAQQQIANERLMRNSFLLGSGLLLLMLGLLYSRFNLKKRANAKLVELNTVITDEKKRSDDLLLNILPGDIAKELKETGKAEARTFKNVSIIFTDVIEFTQTAEKLSAKELVAEINTCFKAFDLICDKYNIEKIKTIGDAYMAASGLPISTPEATKNAILAALEMQAFMQNHKKEKDLQGLPAFEMRAGVHTGSVVAGIVGIKKFQYDIWGDAVNTASRIESNGAVGQVNISQTTFDLIKNEEIFEFNHRGKISAKGKGDMDMYFVKIAAHV